MQSPSPTSSAGPNRSQRKRDAITDAARHLFLHNGYSGTNMDQVAQRAEVSKQTVYKQFASKEALFVEIVKSMTSEAGNRVRGELQDLGDEGDLAAYLLAYAERQLTVVLTPQLMQLRRLIIGEVDRFPDLGKVLYEGGPGRAISAIAAMFERFADRGLLTLNDPLVAATHFNWLVMGEAVNQAMMMGDDAIPPPPMLRRQATDAVRVFLAAYAARN